jgi:hypothetical protein
MRRTIFIAPASELPLENCNQPASRRDSLHIVAVRRMQSAYSQKFRPKYLICCPKSRYIFMNLVGAFEARHSSSCRNIGLYEMARNSLFAGRCENFLMEVNPTERRPKFSAGLS